ncbi:trophoblast glycoprotein-like [Discoglossus pictus]
MSRRRLDFHYHLTTLLFKLIVLLVLAHVSASCPFGCDCYAQNGLVQCQFLPLHEIPHWVQKLSVTGSNITTLQSATFSSNWSHLNNLTTLILANNHIQAIEGSAFSELPMLNTLDLSYNYISSIDQEAFVGQTQLQVLKLNQALLGPAHAQLMDSQWIKSLRNLTNLELTGNGLDTFPSMVVGLHNLHVLRVGNNSIDTIPSDTVSALATHHKLKVYLNPNPLVCDCKLDDVLSWLRNTSQVPDAPYLKCYAPRNLNETRVTLLSHKDLKCINDDLETASYVFFGIVLALIGVIFLMVLYLNRRGIKRWLNNFREACRDQMEGYHYRYEQDSDPRRYNAATGI